MADVKYRFNAAVSGQSREELDKDGVAQAEKFFGTSNVELESAGVTWTILDSGEWGYAGTQTFVERTRSTFTRLPR